jgi:hypothetical protein
MADRTDRIFWIENVLILLAIVALWPRIFLGWSGRGWFAVECLVLAVMVAIFVRRLNAARRRRGRGGE